MLVASADALDQYLMAHPARLLERPVEAAILAPDSEDLRREHLCCAAFEAPLAPRDDRILGDGAYAEAEALADDGVLARTPAGLAWARPTFPAGEVSLRSSSSEVVAIVETGTGALLGTVEAGRAPSSVHPGAVYLHLGDQYHVRALDLRGAPRRGRAVRRRLVHPGADRHDDGGRGDAARGAAWLVAPGARHGRGDRDDERLPAPPRPRPRRARPRVAGPAAGPLPHRGPVAGGRPRPARRRGRPARHPARRRAHA